MGTNRNICESFHRNNDFAVCVSCDVQLIVEDAIVDGDLVGEGECFAVSEELEGG